MYINYTRKQKNVFLISKIFCEVTNIIWSIKCCYFCMFNLKIQLITDYRQSIMYKHSHIPFQNFYKGGLCVIVIDRHWKAVTDSYLERYVRQTTYFLDMGNTFLQGKRCSINWLPWIQGLRSSTYSLNDVNNVWASLVTRSSRGLHSGCHRNLYQRHVYTYLV
jgi:hypothetical protein